MKRMGEAFETAVCKGCGRAIFHIWWGSGGTIWEHADGDMDCAKVPRARPVPETVTSLE